MGFRSQLQTLLAHSFARTDAAIGVRESDGKIIACHDGGDEFELGGAAAGDNTLIVEDNSIRVNQEIFGSNVSSSFITQPPAGLGLGSRTFHYIVPTSAAGGTKNDIGCVSNMLAGAAAVSPTNVDLRTNSPRSSTTSTTQQLVGVNYTDPPFCRGNVDGVGGFFFSWRFAITAINANAVVAIGCNNSVIGAGANPSATANRVVIGADTADAGLSVITVNNAGAFTKSAVIINKEDLLIGDPNTDGPCVYEVQMWATANSSSIHVKMINHSTESVLFDADVTETLPLETTNLRPTCVFGNKTNVAATHEFIHFYGYY